MKQVRIVSISVNVESCSTYEGILQKAEGLILEAAKGSPDIIVLPEAFAHMAYPADEWTDKAEDVYKRQSLDSAWTPPSSSPRCDACWPPPGKNRKCKLP